MGVYDFDLESYIGLARRLGTDTAYGTPER